MEEALHPLAEEYIDRLRKDARRLPRSARHELIEDVRSHLAEATSPTMSDADVLTVIDRLGDPDEIVAAHPASASAAAPTLRVGWHEVAAILLVLVGGFFFGIGWLVGVVLLWTSRLWSVTDKLIGTFLIPGGLAVSLLLFGIDITTTVRTNGTCLEHGGVATTTSTGVVSSHAVLSRIPCTVGSGPGIAHTILFSVLALLPVFAAIYLGLRARSAAARFA